MNRGSDRFQWPSRQELRWAALASAIIVALSCLPYLWGFLCMSRGWYYSGFLSNPDEHNVYLSLMRQARDGSFFFRDMFTAAPQAGRVINVFWFGLGLFARITHLPLPVVYHLARIVAGWLLLMALYGLAAQVLSTITARRAALLLAATASGLGWLFHPGPGQPNPIDFGPGLIMPEAITFLTLLLNPLFAFSMFLLVVIYAAAAHAFSSGSVRAAVLAGLAALVLGNIHSYDMIPVGAVLAVFLAFSLFARRGQPAHAGPASCGHPEEPDPERSEGEGDEGSSPRSGQAHRKILRSERHLPQDDNSAPPPRGRVIALAVLIAVLAAPSLAYQVWLQRAGELSMVVKATNQPPSPEFRYVAFGLGLPLFVAAVGVGAAVRGNSWARLLALWLVIGFALIYVPVSFQRKLIEGLHIPVVLLATYAMERAVSRLRRPEVAPRTLVRVAAVLIIISVPSSLAFLGRVGFDMVTNNTRYTINLMPRLYLSTDERAALDYLSTHARRSDVVLANWWLASYVPSLGGARVYFGHWSETPEYGAKAREYFTFLRASWPDRAREAFVRSRGITYVLTEGKTPGQAVPWVSFDGLLFQWAEPKETVFDASRAAWLEPVFTHGDVTIYRVKDR